MPATAVPAAAAAAAAVTRALVLSAPEVVRVETIDLPAPGPGEVLLRTLACGVCGSDLRYFVGDNPWAQHTLGHQAPIDWNRTVLGHEACAVIEAVGDGVDASRIGETVVVEALHPCGVCAECLSGNKNLCKACSHLGHGGGWPDGYDRPYFPGAMSDRFLYFASECLPLPPGSPAAPEEFALADMVAVGVHAVKRAAQVRARGLGASVVGLVIGCGQVGLSIAQVARTKGAAMTGVDPSAVPRRVADAVGIACVASLDEAGAGPFDAIWDTVCTPETLQVGLSRLAPGGVYVLLAPHEMTFGIPPLAVGGERAVTTSCNFDPPEDLAEALELIGSRQVDMRPYITRRVALADAPQAFDHLHTHRDAEFKVVITP